MNRSRGCPPNVAAAAKAVEDVLPLLQDIAELQELRTDFCFKALQLIARQIV